MSAVLEKSPSSSPVQVPGSTPDLSKGNTPKENTIDLASQLQKTTGKDLVASIAGNKPERAAELIAKLIKSGPDGVVEQALTDALSKPRVKEATMVAAIAAYRKAMAGSPSEMVENAVRSMGANAIEAHLKNNYSPNEGDGNLKNSALHVAQLAKVTGLSEDSRKAVIDKFAISEAHKEGMTVAARAAEMKQIRELFKTDIAGLKAESTEALQKILDGTKADKKGLTFAARQNVDLIKNYGGLSDQEVGAVAKNVALSIGKDSNLSIVERDKRVSELRSHYKMDLSELKLTAVEEVSKLFASNGSKEINSDFRSKVESAAHLGGLSKAEVREVATAYAESLFPKKGEFNVHERAVQIADLKENYGISSDRIKQVASSALSSLIESRPKFDRQFDTNLRDLKVLGGLSDKEVHNVALGVAKSTLENAIKIPEFDKLIAERDFINGVRQRFNLGSSEISINALEVAIKNKASEKISATLAASPVNKESFTSVSNVRNQSGLPYPDVQNVAASEIIKRLDRAPSATNENPTVADIEAARAIAAEYKLDGRRDVEEAKTRNYHKEYDRILPAIAETVEKGTSPHDLKERLVVIKNQYHIPSSVIQDTVLDGLDRKIKSDIAKPENLGPDGKPKAEALLAAHKELVAYGLSFNEESRKLSSQEKFVNLDASLHASAKDRMATLMRGEFEDSPYLSQIDAAKDLRKEFDMSLAEASEIAKGAALSLLGDIQAKRQGGATILGESLKAQEVGILVREFKLGQDKEILAKQAELMAATPKIDEKRLLESLLKGKA